MGMMYFDMKDAPGGDRIAGVCAHCGKAVWESLFTLDDCYNVWAGKCPHCGAINLLAMTGLRGYSSSGMELVLPHDEEKAANNMPEDCPTAGPRGEEPTMHGSILGELSHQLIQNSKEPR